MNITDLTKLIDKHMKQGLKEFEKAEEYRHELNTLLDSGELPPLPKRGNGGDKIDRFYSEVTYVPQKVSDICDRLGIEISTAVVSQHSRFDKHREALGVCKTKSITKGGNKHRVIYRVKPE